MLAIRRYFPNVYLSVIKYSKTVQYLIEPGYIKQSKDSDLHIREIYRNLLYTTMVAYMINVSLLSTCATHHWVKNKVVEDLHEL